MRFDDCPAADFFDGGGVPGDAAEAVTPPPAIPEVVDVHDLDWKAIHAGLNPGGIRGRMQPILAAMDALLASDAWPSLLFDSFRSSRSDRAIEVGEIDDTDPLWFIGDLHGDLLALEAALALIARDTPPDRPPPNIVFLGDLFDDYGFPVEVVLRVFELITAHPTRIAVVTGNHDEALGHDGRKFVATVSPADFSEALNASPDDDGLQRCGMTAIRLFRDAPRALFFPDGLLVAHGGFPLVDLHPFLLETGEWNDERCLTDFVWTRAHPRARRKIPNRVSRGCQFGHEDFADFCAVSRRLDRPVTHMVRGHDHVEDRFEVYEAYAATPVLTTVALSRRLARESFGTYERVPTIARWIRGSLPQVYRLNIPADIVREVYPDAVESPAAQPAATGAATTTEVTSSAGVVSGTSDPPESAADSALDANALAEAEPSASPQ